jgi:two-component system, sensor histidine kinase and response regulator
MMKPPSPLVLIIDDEPTIRDGCRQALEKSGYVVLDAGEGDEGIKIARDAKPDIALIDLKLPGVSGMEIIEILCRDLPDMVLVMITGYATIVSAVEAIQKGTYDYLPKPFSPDQLRAVVRRAVEHRDLKIETRRLREEKERMEKSFITFVSHEMRSPLVVIRQYIEALKAVAGDRLDPNMAEIIERCSVRIQGLETLVERWLDISRIGEGSFVWKKEPLNLLHLIGRSTEEMAPICHRKGIDLKTDLPDHLPEILGDQESLLRVFTNIIGNAAKYTPEKGRITISARDVDYHVMVRVSDTGAGMPADKLPFIFEPFYRVKGREEQQRGTGLGLTFCKKIMELHGGEITAASTEGQGSTFLLKFLTHMRSERTMDNSAIPFRPSEGPGATFARS